MNNVSLDTMEKPKEKSHEELIAKAKKLKGYADRGIGGEKDNAKRMLQEFLEKNNIDISEISPENHDRIFALNNEEEILVITNVILSINPYAKIEREEFDIKCILDKEDFDEVKTKYQHFISLWIVEKRMMSTLFFTKHEKHFRPDEYAWNKFRDGKKEKNPAFQEREEEEIEVEVIAEQIEKGKKKFKDLTEKQKSEQKIKEFNDNRMNDMLRLMLNSHYTRKHKK